MGLGRRGSRVFRSLADIKGAKSYDKKIFCSDSGAVCAVLSGRILRDGAVHVPSAFRGGGVNDNKGLAARRYGLLLCPVRRLYGRNNML